MRKRYAIIVAAGSGTRMGSRIPKQFLELASKPILRHTIEPFLKMENPAQIILVLSPEYKEWWKEYCRKEMFLPKYHLPSGGFTRFHSVKNALDHVPDGALVAIHDGVRPFVTPDFLEELFQKAEKLKAVVPACKPVESIREVSDDRSFILKRDNIRLIQTPQVFHSELVKAAYSQPFNEDFTDDASVVEYYGETIHLVEGIRSNIKITTSEDMVIANALLAMRDSE